MFMQPALAGLDFHRLDSFERFHQLIWNSPLPRFAWCDIPPSRRMRIEIGAASAFPCEVRRGVSQWTPSVFDMVFAEWAWPEYREEVRFHADALATARISIFTSFPWYPFGLHVWPGALMEHSRHNGETSPAPRLRIIDQI